MTLQQLRYLIAVAEYGSINKAAASLYASQSNLSTAIKDLERELGITIFTRNNRGVALTNDGAELVSYARQVMEQVSMIEERYSPAQQSFARLAVSTQHYAFSLQAFMEVADRFAGDEYDFILRETTTAQIISDVATFRSDAGILYLDSFNERVLMKAFADSHLTFTPLFSARTHVFMSEKHPLAKSAVLKLEDLADYPRYSCIMRKSRWLICPTARTSPSPTAAPSPTCLPTTAATRSPPACFPKRCTRASCPFRWRRKSP